MELLQKSVTFLKENPSVLIAILTVAAALVGGYLINIRIHKTNKANVKNVKNSEVNIRQDIK